MPLLLLLIKRTTPSYAGLIASAQLVILERLLSLRTGISSFRSISSQAWSYSSSDCAGANPLHLCIVPRDHDPVASIFPPLVPSAACQCIADHVADNEVMPNIAGIIAEETELVTFLVIASIPASERQRFPVACYTSPCCGGGGEAQFVRSTLWLGG